jgi:hypothetical protein
LLNLLQELNHCVLHPFLSHRCKMLAPASMRCTKQF